MSNTEHTVWFIDDEPDKVDEFADALREKGHEVLRLTSSAELDLALRDYARPSAIVLDVMFPGDPAYRGFLSSEGLLAGLAIFAGLRGQFPDVPVVVLTNHSGAEVRSYFSQQRKCSLWMKDEILPAELATLLTNLVSDRGINLLLELEKCARGKEGFIDFENLAGSLLDFLLVPPMERVLCQVPREDGLDVRDIVIPNTAGTGFWRTVREEFASRHIVIECKNFSDAVRKNEVRQLQDYLSRKSIGRFGILVSRVPPSTSAMGARAKAYEDSDILILFVDDEDLTEMVYLRGDGKDPAAVLARKKEEFELAY